jgi:hypothetical protein
VNATSHDEREPASAPAATQRHARPARITMAHYDPDFIDDSDLMHRQRGSLRTKYSGFFVNEVGHMHLLHLKPPPPLHMQHNKQEPVAVPNWDTQHRPSSYAGKLGCGSGAWCCCTCGRTCSSAAKQQCWQQGSPAQCAHQCCSLCTTASAATCSSQAHRSWAKAGRRNEEGRHCCTA